MMMFSPSCRVSCRTARINRRMRKRCIEKNRWNVLDEDQEVNVRIMLDLSDFEKCVAFNIVLSLRRRTTISLDDAEFFKEIKVAALAR